MRALEIKSREELEKALERLDEIWAARPGDAEWEERRDLVEAVSAYEDATVHIPLPDPVDALLFRMDQGGLQQKDLIPFIGSASKVSEVLSRKRGLSKEMICRLHAGLGIPLASLLGVEQEIPEGFELVEWVLPSGVVARATAAAKVAGLSVSDVVARSLTTVAWNSGNPVVITGEARTPEKASETVFTGEGLALVG